MARLTQWTPQARVITHQQTTNICMQSVHCQNCTHKMKLWNSNWAAWWIQIHKLKLNMLTVQQTTVQVVRALSLFDFVCVMWSVSGLWCCLLCLHSVFLCPIAAGISHLIWLFVKVPQQKTRYCCRLTRYMEKKEEGYSNVDGSNPYGKPFSPSSMTPLSETGGFAQRNDLRGYWSPAPPNQCASQALIFRIVVVVHRGTQARTPDNRLTFWIRCVQRAQTSPRPQRCRGEARWRPLASDKNISYPVMLRKVEKWS